MKVLLLSPLPKPSGGIATWTISIMEYAGLKKAGFEIVLQDTSLKYRDILKNDILIRVLYGIKEFVRVRKDLMGNIKKHVPDIIHFTSSGSLALFKCYFLSRTSKKYNIPFIIHWHFGRIPELSIIQNWEWKFLVHIIGKSCASVVIDPESFRILKEKSIENVFYVPNPISLTLENKIRNPSPFINQRVHNRLIYVGHVIKTKGIRELIEATVRVPEIKELLILGPFESSFVEELKEIARVRENGQWIQFVGVVDNGQVLNHLLKSSIFLLPSYTEGFPISVLEAMAMGCPVIATNVGAIPEMLAINSDKPCGICIPPRNIEKLQEAICFLMKNTQKAEVLGKNGIDRVLNNYTLERVFPQYTTIWSEVILKT